MNSDIKIKNSKFNIGDLVVHDKQGYRAVIVDIDPLFQASKRHNPQANKYDFAKNNLWYRLLVDNSTLETYVKESALSKDTCPVAIENPNVDNYLTHEDGKYQAVLKHH
ncbi:MAG: heat shock protein HspQ [Legionellaceae bacterium]|nr:heat shock protein HspQ [Legionellaceae bacterium]